MADDPGLHNESDHRCDSPRWFRSAAAVKSGAQNGKLAFERGAVGLSFGAICDRNVSTPSEAVDREYTVDGHIRAIVVSAKPREIASWRLGHRRSGSFPPESAALIRSK